MNDRRFPSWGHLRDVIAVASASYALVAAITALLYDSEWRGWAALASIVIFLAITGRPGRWLDRRFER